jgi:phenylpyruvate tautomerase PptA (4-oxalocrotonate tautomerase family)
MPTFHAYLPAGRFTNEQKRNLADALHRALMEAFGTPPGDRFIIMSECPSSGNLRLIRRFEKRGSGTSGLEFKRPAVGAASDGLRWWQV